MAQANSSIPERTALRNSLRSVGIAMSLPAVTQRRLLADWKRLQQEPLPLASARPRQDRDLTLWDGAIGVELCVGDLGVVTAPLHFLIDFPVDYPQRAPNIGFSFNFPYRDGASYIDPSGRLQGKLVICLDILGNFAHVHTEWKGQRGTGWTAAYTVTTLLVQLQSVLCNIGKSMSADEREDLYCTALRFAEKHPSMVPELLTEEEIMLERQELEKAKCLAAACGADEDLQCRVKGFAREAKLKENPALMSMFLQILVDVSARRTAGSESALQPAAEAVVAAPEPAVDRNICRFATGALYTEDMLGVGVSRKGKNLSTPAELLSLEAYKGGLRQSTDKLPFEFFLPVWINQKHAAASKTWPAVLTKSCLEIGKIYDVKNEEEAILEVFPRLINQMIVEMMRPDQEKTEAIATFEALCNFWRTLRWLLDTRAPLRGRVGRKLLAFVQDEKVRHKDVSPDLGMVLALYTVLQGYEGCPSRKAFIDAYADENFVRCVMWWQSSGVPAKAMPVFEATKVSREICMFQLMVMDVIVGDNVQRTLREMEETNCKIPHSLELLQRRWREQKVSVDGWKKYFELIGASLPSFPSCDAWVADCVYRASAKGPKYQKHQQGRWKGRY